MSTYLATDWQNRFLPLGEIRQSGQHPSLAGRAEARHFYIFAKFQLPCFQGAPLNRI
ncbi:MAG: hypothetical protein FWE98_07800 [Oscillospiraceae bacterium]|nr:hypothetical protein [Oscillospiraceae bacterium]